MARRCGKGAGFMPFGVSCEVNAVLIFTCFVAPLEFVVCRCLHRIGVTSIELYGGNGRVGVVCGLPPCGSTPRALAYFTFNLRGRAGISVFGEGNMGSRE